jgi:CPA2 family monovalent cation:H+ antiporter-2
VLRLAHELNPDIRVLARANYLRERADLLKVGADSVFAAEGEVALAMSESLLRELGASPDQIDRERARVREELFGEASPPPRSPDPATPEQIPPAAPPPDIPTVAVRPSPTPQPPVS